MPKHTRSIGLPSPIPPVQRPQPASPTATSPGQPLSGLARTRAQERADREAAGLGDVEPGVIAAPSAPLDAALGAAAGAATGAFAGPPGAVVGGLIGAAIGAAVGLASERQADERVAAQVADDEEDAV